MEPRSCLIDERRWVERPPLSSVRAATTPALRPGRQRGTDGRLALDDQRLCRTAEAQAAAAVADRPCARRPSPVARERALRSPSSRAMDALHERLKTDGKMNLANAPRTVAASVTANGSPSSSTRATTLGALITSGKSDVAGVLREGPAAPTASSLAHERGTPPKRLTGDGSRSGLRRPEARSRAERGDRRLRFGRGGLVPSTMPDFMKILQQAQEMQEILQNPGGSSSTYGVRSAGGGMVTAGDAPPRPPAQDDPSRREPRRPYAED